MGCFHDWLCCPRIYCPIEIATAAKPNGRGWKGKRGKQHHHTSDILAALPFEPYHLRREAVEILVHGIYMIL